MQFSVFSDGSDSIPNQLVLKVRFNYERLNLSADCLNIRCVESC